MRLREHRPWRHCLLTALAAPSLLLSACNPLSPEEEEEEERRLGVIDVAGHPSPLESPDTVSRGLTFRVTVWTVGGGCTRAGDTEMNVEGAQVWLTPYDIHRRTGITCAGLLRPLEHPVQLQFHTTGQARVMVSALDIAGNPVTLQHAVWVR